MATYNKFLCFAQDVGRKVHNLHTDTLKVALTNTQPVNTNTVIGDITQISNGNGYTTGGTALTNQAYSQTSGTGKLTADDVVFTSVTGNMGPFQWAVLYNDTSSGKELIGWWERPAAITLDGTQGDTFTLDINASNGVAQIT